MKTVAAASILAFVASSVVASEFANRGTSPVHARLHISHSKMRREASGKHYKRCKPHNKEPTPDPQPTSAVPTSTNVPAPTNAPAPAPAPGGNNNGGSGGVISVKTSGCGPIGATPNPGQTSGPNGAEEWLNCGIQSGGWNPPMIRISDLKYKNLDDEFNSKNTIFAPCRPFQKYINDAAVQTGLPAIMIASIMMQESSCNKATVGGGGERGLMQITPEKCGGRSFEACMDPAYNIPTGASYLKSQVDQCNGNVLEAVGSYNGWFRGLTYAKATAAAKTPCCTCQNNLDYPHQFFNGWMQGKDAYSSNMGSYKNLNVCHNQ